MQRYNFRLLASLFVVLIVAGKPVSAQQDTVFVRPLIDLIDMGRSGEVRVVLPTLVSENPSDPGVRFLVAVFEPDAARAVQTFTELVRVFPGTAAAEASARRLVLYYETTGSVADADRYRNYLKQRNLSPVPTVAKPVAPVTAAKPTEKPKTKNATPVKPEPEKPRTPPAEPVVETPRVVTTPPTAASGRFFIQAGAYTIQSQANKGLKTAEKSGFKGKVIKEVTNNRIFYKVRIGPYASQPDAKSALAAVSTKLGINGFIVEE